MFVLLWGLMIAVASGLRDCSGANFQRFVLIVVAFHTCFCGYCDCNLMSRESLHVGGVA